MEDEEEWTLLASAYLDSIAQLSKQEDVEYLSVSSNLAVIDSLNGATDVVGSVTVRQSAEGGLEVQSSGSVIHVSADQVLSVCFSDAINGSVVLEIECAQNCRLRLAELSHSAVKRIIEDLGAPIVQPDADCYGDNAWEVHASALCDALVSATTAAASVEGERGGDAEEDEEGRKGPSRRSLQKRALRFSRFPMQRWGESSAIILSTDSQLSPKRRKYPGDVTICPLPLRGDREGSLTVPPSSSSSSLSSAQPLSSASTSSHWPTCGELTLRPEQMAHRKVRRSDLSWERLKARLRRFKSRGQVGAIDAPAQPPPVAAPARLYRPFARQAAACECADEFNRASSSSSAGKEARVFSYEGFSSGRRQFLAADLESFCARYWKTALSHRHTYEIIRQNHPCRLYLDLEYEVSTASLGAEGREFAGMGNEEITPLQELAVGPALVEQLIELLRKALHDHYGIRVQRSDIVEMDSSTARKFSRHLVFHLPFSANDGEVQTTSAKDTSRAARGQNATPLAGSNRVGEYLFKNNEHVGAFVKNIAMNLLESTLPTSASRDVGLHPKGENGPPHSLWLKRHAKTSLEASTASQGSDSIDSPSRWTFLADLAVYTRNRAFRLYGSRKFGRPPCMKPTLWLARTNEFPIPRECCDNSEIRAEGSTATAMHRRRLLLEASLVVPQLRQPNGRKCTLSEAIASGHVRLLEFLPAIEPVPLGALQGGYLSPVELAPPTPTETRPSFKTAEKVDHGEGNSPFLVVDGFVKQLISGHCRGEGASTRTEGGSNGGIRAWSLMHAHESGTSHSPIAGRYTITYQICRYRFCERIKRPHRSNHIKIVVSFWVNHSESCNSRLEIDGIWRQRCHDPECSHYPFQAHSLPPSLLSEIREVLIHGPYKEK